MTDETLRLVDRTGALHLRLREQASYFKAGELWGGLSRHPHLRHIAGEPDDDQWIFCEDDSPGSIFEVSLPSGADVFLRDLEIFHAEGSLRSVIHLSGEEALHLLEGYGIRLGLHFPDRLQGGIHPIKAARELIFGSEPLLTDGAKAVLEQIKQAVTNYYLGADEDTREMVAVLLDLFDPRIGTDAVLRLSEEGLRKLEQCGLSYPEVLVEMIEAALVIVGDAGRVPKGKGPTAAPWDPKALWPDPPPILVLVSRPSGERDQGPSTD